MTEEWFETWFDTKYYHILYRNRDENEACQFIGALLRFLEPPEKAHFLDVACGKGRHSVYLNKLGYEVTGIDLSQNNIRAARKHQCRNLHFDVRDMREPLNEGIFDYALNLFTSFGYFDHRNEHLRAIRNVASALRDQGTFVIDYLNVDYVRSHLVKEEVQNHEGIEFRINRTLKDGFIYKHIQVRAKDEVAEFTERVMAFERDDLEALLTEAGLQVQHCFGDYELQPWSADRPRVIIIAQKNV